MHAIAQRDDRTDHFKVEVCRKILLSSNQGIGYGRIEVHSKMPEWRRVCPIGKRLEEQQLHGLLVDEAQGAIRCRERIRHRFRPPHGTAAHHP
jgi:hypothetical protein